MAGSIFQGIRSLFGPNLGIWASQIHAFTLSLLALAWFWPVLTALFKHLPKSEPDIEWIQLWRCPECSTYNRRAMTICTHCEYHIKIGIFARWIPLSLSEFTKRNARRLLRLYQLAGWVLFYGSTLWAFWVLKMYSFRQNSVQEVLGCGVLIFLLIALMFFRLVFRPEFKSPISVLLDLVAGCVTSGALLFVLFLWAQATAQFRLSNWLIAGYDASLGRLHLFESKPSVVGVSKPLAPRPVKPPQKTARRRGLTDLEF